MANRRIFIRDFAVAGAAAMISPSCILAQEARRLKKIGFISGILEQEMNRDWKSALMKAASYGYTELETGGFWGDSPEDFLKFCKDINLIPVAGFVNFTGTEEEIRKNLDLIQSLQMKFAVTYWPWYSGGPFTLEECKRSAGRLNYLGDLCRKNDVIFCWHNHNKEFTAMEEGLPFDFLMAHTDPDLVKCEMDVYWAKKGGADPLALLKKYPGRVAILHIKDMAPGPEQDFACPGNGIIDFRPVLREAVSQGINHFMVERDNETNGLACLKSSSGHLLNLQF